LLERVRVNVCGKHRFSRTPRAADDDVALHVDRIRVGGRLFASSLNVSNARSLKCGA
jgi:hypothetical protein